MIYIVKFTPLDFLFFRNLQAFENYGGNTIETLFPPNKSTLVGAFRALLLRKYAMKKNYKEQHVKSIFHTQENKPFIEKFGKDSKDFGCIDYYGPFITKSDDILSIFPEYDRTINSSNYNNFIKYDFKSLSNNNFSGYEKSEIYLTQEKSGIEIDNSKKAVKEKMLYTIQEIKLRHNVSLALIVETKDEEICEFINSMNEEYIYLGGEGKISQLKINELTIDTIDINITSNNVCDFQNNSEQTQNSLVTCISFVDQIISNKKLFNDLISFKINNHNNHFHAIKNAKKPSIIGGFDAQHKTSKQLSYQYHYGQTFSFDSSQSNIIPLGLLKASINIGNGYTLKTMVYIEKLTPKNKENI